MADVIRMPEVLAGADEAAIQSWLVQAGDAIVVDQTLAEIETEKAIVEFQAESAGIVGRLLATEGDTISVGDPILVMVGEGEGDSEIDSALAAAGVAVQPTAAPAPEDAPAPEPVSAPTPPEQTEDPPRPASTPEEPSPDSTDGRRLFASPLVRRLATEQGIDLAVVPGSGPNGRVTRRDLERHLAEDEAAQREAPAAESSATTSPTRAVQSSDYEDVPLDRMRKAIARRLTESKSTVPHFYLVADCRVDALLALRTQVNAAAPRKISVNDFVLKAVAAALLEVPAANAIWNGDSIRRFSGADISVAVATEGGLMTPVVRGVDRMPLTKVSEAVADFAERARSGRLKQHELEGGSFSVSNLGMYGTAQFSAILNPPQSGILAVGAARTAPVVGADGELSVGQVMTVTLSADHRVLDGAVAAEWLAAFQRCIENPLTTLI